MSSQTIFDIAPAEAERIRQQVLNKIAEMDAAELQVQRLAHSSFAEFLTQVAYEVAGLLGYAIAIPLAWVQNVFEGVAVGLEDGFARGMRDQRVRPRRRR
jgi:hypothetical protein